MNTRNFLLNICLGTGLLFINYFLASNKASAVSLKPSFEESSLESILKLELSLEEELDLMSLGDLESVGSPIQVELPVQVDSLLVNEDIEVPLNIEIFQEEQPELLQSLVTSLKELEFNGQISNSEARISGENRNTIIILSQTDSSGIYQDVYDFDTELTEDVRSTPRNVSQNVVDNQKSPGLFKQEILTYTYVAPRSRQNNLANINQNTSQIGGVGSLSRNHSYIKLGSSSYYTQTQAPTINNINYRSQGTDDFDNGGFDIKKIRAIQSTNIARPSLNKTKQQIELEKRLAEQRKELQKKNQQLRKKLAKEQKERAKQRARARKERLKQQKERFKRIAQQQAKFRNRNR